MVTAASLLRRAWAGEEGDTGRPLPFWRGSLASNPDLGHRNLFPAPLLEQGLPSGVSNAERADEDSPLALA